MNNERNRPVKPVSMKQLFPLAQLPLFSSRSYLRKCIEGNCLHKLLQCNEIIRAVLEAYFVSYSISKGPFMFVARIFISIGPSSMMTKS
jgi:hypothetical protein